MANDDTSRRIAQLEAALMRRTELLEQKHAALCAIYESGAWKAVRLYYRLRDQLLPLHSRRRTAVKWAMRSLFRAAKWLLGVVRPQPAPDGTGLGEAPDPDVYRKWINKYEPKPADLRRQSQHRFGRQPTISLAVPVYNPPIAFLRALLESIRTQTYAHWELVLADGGSTAPQVRALLEQYAAADARIKPVFLPENRGIVGNSNAALAACTGQYIGLVDHDDTLAPFALHEIVTAINNTPAADFIYSDEDKLDLQGQRVEPNFKPDWSPETLRGRNYICHLSVFKADLVQQIGGFRAGFDGSQDYDLILRASEHAQRIVHIPKILYHWRMHAQSTAANKSSKHYAFDAGKRALSEHYQRAGIHATVTDGPILGTYGAIFHLATQPLVSIIIPNRDQAQLLARCIDSLGRSSYANYEIILIENGSSQPETHAYYRTLAAQPNVKILTWDKPFNYAAVNNFAAVQARGELLLFLNNDIEAINPDWLEHMVKLAVQPGVGAVGAKLYYADDTVQHAGIILGMGGIAGHAHLHYPRAAGGYMQRLLYAQNCAAVTGACLLTPRTVFERVGGFDEGFVLAFNDVDLCVQIHQRGWRVVWTPEAELYHYESKTRGYEDTDEKQARFKREIDLFRSKWAHLLDQGDPYYNPNFRLDRADWCLKT
jgi:GT2 family glycosyltransferase